MTDADVKAWLQGRDRDELVTMLSVQAGKDEVLGRTLRLAAAKSHSKKIDLGSYRAAIQRAVFTDDYVDIRHMPDYAHGIEEAVSGIMELLREGYAAEVVELAEDALEIVESAFEACDDSDGYLGSILDDLQDLHHRACQKARPDPEILAERLFRKEMSSGFDVFYGAAGTYADVLGPQGLATYRRLAEERWAALRPLEPGDREDRGSSERFAITSIMTALAHQSGDVEALVAVKKRDLSFPYRFLQIAETYEKAGKADLALEWAEKGMAAFPDRTDARLAEFLASKYHEVGRHDDAMRLVWAEFVRAPHLDAFKTLARHGRRVQAWAEWRDKALTLIRKQVETSKKKALPGAFFRGPDHSRLVEILLWEKDVDAAWAEAQAGGCSTDLWLDLARHREKKHPEDALAIYLSQIEPTLRPTNDKAYRAAVALLEKIHGLMGRLGQRTEFARYLESLRTTHKAKRNLLKLLGQMPWS